MKPICNEEEVRNGILVKTQYLPCYITKRHVNEGLQDISKVETSEYVDKEASSGVKSTFQMMTQEDIVCCNTAEGIRQYG